MGIIQKDALRTTILSYLGIGIGTLNRAVLFVICLSTEQIGLVNLVVAVGLLFAQMANFGSVASILKFFPYFKNEEKRHHGFITLMLLYVFIGILVCLIAFYLFRPLIESMYLERSPLFISYYNWVLPIGISYVLFQFFDAHLRSLHRNILSVFIFEVVLRLLVTGLLLLVYFKTIPFETFVILNSLIYAVPTLILFVYLIKIKELNLQSKRITISKKYRKILVQYSSFNYLNNLGVILVTTLDIMMIAKLVGLSETGVYSTVFFLVSATLIPFKSIIKISTPIVAEQWKYKKMNEMEELYKKVSSISLLIGIFFFLSIWLNVEFLFAIPGKEFSQGVWVFFFLMLGRLTDMYCGINGLIFLTSKKYKFELFFTVFMILAVYLLNLWLIPKFGMTGAAISTAFAIIVYNFGRVLFIYKVYRIHLFTKKQFLLILTGLLTFMVGDFIQGIFRNEIVLFLTELFVVIVFFVLPVYIFKMEEEFVSYVNRMWSFLRMKFSKNDFKN